MNKPVPTLTPLQDAKQANYLHDPHMAVMLTKLAALQGHAVPAYRFGMVENTADGVQISSLSRQHQARELWRAHFPSAAIHEIVPGRIERGQFPLLWVSRSDQRVLLLRGQLSSGHCSTEDAEGHSGEISAQELAGGHVLMLKPAVVSLASGADAPKTAGDWFVYAIRQYRSVFFDAVLATSIVSMVGLVGAMYSMQVYDRVVPSKGYSTLFVLSVGALLGVVLELILKQVRAHMIDRACKAIDQDLSAVFFGKALDIRMDARPRTVGTFASQIRYFESVRNFMTSSSLFVLADAPFALFFIVVIASISVPVALVPVVLLPLAFLVGALLRKPIEGLTALHMAESNRKNGLLIEAIDGIESIKASNAEWKLLERWRELTAIIGASELKSKALTTFSSNITQTLQQLIYIGMVAVGAYEITQGQLTMGGLIACTIISGRALGPFAQIPSLIVQWKQAQIALKSLDGIMALPNDRDETQRLVVPQTCQGQIKLDKVAFGYGPGQPSLQVAELNIAPGERIAIVGSIGSGKSTLIKILSGLYKPQQGTMFLDGLDITQLAPEFVREHIGYLPQDVRLYQGTLRENLTLGLPSPGDSQILKAAALTGLDRVIQNHPKGLELEIAEGGRGLSGGQRQLVGLTRMLLQQPRIMLLDEPTASMDGQLEALVMQHLFQEIPAQSALVVVTHKPALLAHIQRLIVVEQGRIVLDGPRDQVLARLRGQTTAGGVSAIPSNTDSGAAPASPAQGTA
jgi:ATP-binding cassette, subfamily C, bacterial LapB